MLNHDLLDSPEVKAELKKCQPDQELAARIMSNLQSTTSDHQGQQNKPANLNMSFDNVKNSFRETYLKH
jgi:hypothetical protein